MEKSTQPIVRLNVAKNVKLMVGGNEFHTFMIRSTNKISRRLREHCDLYSLYLCPRIVGTALSAKKSSKLTDTRPNITL